MSTPTGISGDGNNTVIQKGEFFRPMSCMLSSLL
jgi:hypothetical protein